MSYSLSIYLVLVEVMLVKFHSSVCLYSALWLAWWDLYKKYSVGEICEKAKQSIIDVYILICHCFLKIKTFLHKYKEHRGLTMYQPDYPSALGLLSHLNADELKEMLNDDTKFDETVLKDVKQVNLITYTWYIQFNRTCIQSIYFTKNLTIVFICWLCPKEVTHWSISVILWFVSK